MYNKQSRKIVVSIAALAVSIVATDTFADVRIGPPSPPPSGANLFISDEPPSNFFPGKYFENKGQFYLRKKDYHTALKMFELSGFWANKIAQYNVGIMYFNGIGIPVDRSRGVAWLRIAAQAHDDLADNVLQLATATLSADELAEVDQLTPELNAKYGDQVAVARALHHYSLALKSTTGSHLGFIGNLSVSEASETGAQAQNGATYYASLNTQRDKLLNRITGHVTVGKVQALPVTEDAKTNASQVPVNAPNPGMP